MAKRGPSRTDLGPKDKNVAVEPLKRLSVSEVTTLHSSFDSDVTNYSAAGLGGIGLWESKLAGRDLDEVGG